MIQKKTIDLICLIIVIIGGIDLGLYGLFKLDIISFIFGFLARLLFIIIGVAACYLIYSRFIKRTPNL